MTADTGNASARHLTTRANVKIGMQKRIEELVRSQSACRRDLKARSR